MAQLSREEAFRLINTFNPLNQIAPKYHPQLTSQLELIIAKAGETIIKPNKHSEQFHFLVKGHVEIRESFEDRYPLNHSDHLCNQPLESRLKNRSSIKALEDCTLLVADANQVSQLLEWSQDYSIFYLDEDDLSLNATDLIDDNYQDDWENVFIRSNLAANLTNTIIHQLMSQLENIKVKANDTIIKAQTCGDYFYLIKQGNAEVHSDPKGPFRGEHFTLGPGNYFGDEALVAETTRNATVTMTTDGVLGRLTKEQFNELIKQYLVNPLNADTINLEDDVQLLDVRFPIEYKRGHKKNSTNMPISFLRLQLQDMQQSLLYVVSPADDSRGELATYLMRQAGYRAYQAND